MNSYSAENMAVLAKRHNNAKRAYLLVNPLQAKHLPVSPAESLNMMTSLGAKAAVRYPEAKLVIGFAETATAIGAVVAGSLSGDCTYIHTTREDYPDPTHWLYFNEEHSHAVEQKLYIKDLDKIIAATPQIIFVDDEISTGKTLLNIVGQLRMAFPEARDKRIAAVSILNRISAENRRRFSDSGIECEYLAELPGDDLTEAVSRFQITPAAPVYAAAETFDGEATRTTRPLPDPRLGVRISMYKDCCRDEAERLSENLLRRIPQGSRILVLGTEECMYPSLILGRELERSGHAASVSCHATTRSPIGICNDRAYPIRSGRKLHSFYNRERETYIYDLSSYDAAIILTDTAEDDLQARADISQALKDSGCPRVIVVEGGRRV